MMGGGKNITCHPPQATPSSTELKVILSVLPLLLLLLFSVRREDKKSTAELSHQGGKDASSILER
jgi:hypothetical protein